MIIQTSKNLQVLIVENDAALIQSFKECIRDEVEECTPRVEIELTVARNMAAAFNSLENMEAGFDVVLMDIMLPLNDNELKELEKYEIQRKQIQSKLLHLATEEKVVETTGEIARLRKELSNIDDLIDINLDIEGGYNVIQKYLNTHNLSCYDKPIIFLSARGQIELKERCMKLATVEKCIWIEKPISEVDIFRKIVSFYGIEIPEEEWR